MSDVIQVTEQVEIIEVDETHVEIIESSNQLVSSVNGQIGAVDLDATDVGAEPLGAALQAYQDAQAYANTLAQGLTAALQAHETNTSNPHVVTKAQVGLGSVDNTSDADKPVSTAQQAALFGKVDFPTTNSTVPVRGISGTQVAITYSETATASSIVRRDSAGATSTANATANTHAVNKAQLDAGLALQVSKAGDTMTGHLTSSFGGFGFSQTRSGRQVSWGVDSKGDFLVYDTTSGSARFNISSTSRTMSLGFIGLDPQATYGTGFPNGVVSAPVGSIYIDTAVTNGASSWIKKSGTGNTGWTVLEGDTGWRDITSLAPVGSITSGSLRIRRIANRIFINAGNLFIPSDAETVLIADIGASLGAAFRPIDNTSAIITASVTAGVIKMLQIAPTATTTGIRHYGVVSTRYWSTSYDTTQDWPATLPGTAA